MKGAEVHRITLWRQASTDSAAGARRANRNCLIARPPPSASGRPRRVKINPRRLHRPAHVRSLQGASATTSCRQRNAGGRGSIDETVVGRTAREAGIRGRHRHGGIGADAGARRRPGPDRQIIAAHGRQRRRRRCDTTGRFRPARGGYGTPSGIFHPQSMARRYFSRKYYNAPMPHAIFFYGGFAIHGTNELSRLGGPASHGCVRLHPSHAAALFCTGRAQRPAPYADRDFELGHYQADGRATPGSEAGSRQIASIENLEPADRKLNGSITLSIIDEISCALAENAGIPPAIWNWFIKSTGFCGVLARAANGTGTVQALVPRICDFAC